MLRCNLYKPKEKHLMMDYFLIKNGEIVTADAIFKSDLLIGGDKIVQIGDNIQRPTLDTIEYDASNKYIIPGLIESFTKNAQNYQQSESDELAIISYNHIIAGYTTWLCAQQIDDIDSLIADIKRFQSASINCGIHILLSNFKHGDITKVRKTSLAKGTPTILVQFPLPENIKMDRIEMFAEFAAKNNIEIVFDCKDVDGSNIKELSKLCGIIQSSKCQATFLNIKYEEELSEIAKLEQVCNIGCEICYMIKAENETESSLHSFSADEYCNILKKNKWCFAGAILLSNNAIVGNDISGTQFIQRNNLAMLTTMLLNKEFTISDIVNVTSTRVASRFGLSPEKGNICVGADADIIIWNPKYEQNIYFNPSDNCRIEALIKGKIETILMNGKIVLENKLNNGNIAGKYCYRRIIHTQLA